MTRLIDADKLHPDCFTKDGKLAISQSQLADAPTVYTNGEYEALCKITDAEFEVTNGFWVQTPKGQKIYFEKKRPQGKWIKATSDSNYYEITCSECCYGFEYEAQATNYCPNCGAKMNGDTE